MPPKKGAKAIEEDFSDVPTLPELNSLIFTMILEFKNKDRRQEVSDKIKDTWKEKVKVVTREDIIEYGKKKLTIEEDEDVNDISKVAKSASEKLYEQFVQARREKKERIEKLFEDAKAQATDDNPDPQPVIDTNEIDCFFYMPDYPKTSEEVAALNSWQYALNAMIYVEERPAIIEKKIDPELDADGNPIEGTEQVVMEEEQVPETSQVPDDENEELKQTLSNIKLALKSSAKDTAIRNFVVLKKEYNHRVVEPVEEGQEPPAEPAADEPVGIETEVFDDLHKIASDLMKFKNFKMKTNLVKLKAQKLQPEHESTIVEPQEAADEEGSKAEQDETAKDASKVDKSKLPEGSKIEESKVEGPPPLPEETMPREWSDESYHKIVNDLPEDKKSIAGLLAA